MTHRNASYLEFIRQLPCIACSTQAGVQAAHVRMAGDGGIGLKPSDYRAVPLCARCHGEQHQHGEATFWRARGADPNAVIIRLITAYIVDRHGQWMVVSGPRIDGRRAVVDALAAVVEGQRRGNRIA